jgi:hypothetical protein
LLGAQIAIAAVELCHAAAHASMAGPKAFAIAIDGSFAILFSIGLTLMENDQRTCNSLVVVAEQFDNLTLVHF